MRHYATVCHMDTKLEVKLVTCHSCGKVSNLVLLPITTFSDLKRTTCPECGVTGAFVLPGNRTFTRSPENRAKQAKAARAAWASHKAILERAMAAGSGVDPTNERYSDYGAKTKTYHFLVQMLRRINFDSGKPAKKWIRLLEFDPWGKHKALVTSEVLQYAFGISLESAALCQRLFRVRVDVVRSTESKGEQP